MQRQVSKGLNGLVEELVAWCWIFKEDPTFTLCRYLYSRKSGPATLLSMKQTSRQAVSLTDIQAEQKDGVLQYTFTGIKHSLFLDKTTKV